MVRRGSVAIAFARSARRFARVFFTLGGEIITGLEMLVRPATRLFIIREKQVAQVTVGGSS